MRIAKIVRIVVCSNLPTISNKGQVILKLLVERKTSMIMYDIREHNCNDC
jgi:hypothetical protein